MKRKEFIQLLGISLPVLLSEFVQLQIKLVENQIQRENKTTRTFKLSTM